MRPRLLRVYGFFYAVFRGALPYLAVWVKQATYKGTPQCSKNNGLMRVFMTFACEISKQINP